MTPHRSSPEFTTVCKNCNGTRRALYFSEQSMAHEMRDCHMCRTPATPMTSREELAETIHNARWPADRKMAITPFADEDRNGREYCFRIADAILAQRIGVAQAPTPVAISRLKDISCLAREAYPTNNGTWEGMVKMIGRLADEGLSSHSSTGYAAKYRKAVDDVNRMNDKGEIPTAVPLQDRGGK